MLRCLSGAALAAAVFACAAPALAQNVTMSASYASPGVNPGGSIQLKFFLYTSEVSPDPMSGGAFTYTVPAGLTATGYALSPFCPATGSSLVGNVLSVSGISQTASFICEIVLDLQADGTLTTYPLTPTTLTFATPTGGSFAMVGGSNATLTVTHAPVVGQLSPASGPLEGGTSVVITGTNFNGVTSVTFGGIPAGFTVNSPTQITAVAPPAAKGARNISISALGGPSLVSPSSSFIYAEPVPTLTEWAMILMATVLAGCGALFVQRRRAA
ncbi:IPT/TIG domain-containing protein [Brevundimonas sp. 2YAF1]|uniref:IPT/TIG domain-containing protein n=1 Tax=Brevundimonas sp. 2YAF1 TaxID=3233024 RepID=UPI003F8DC992